MFFGGVCVLWRSPSGKSGRVGDPRVLESQPTPNLLEIVFHYLLNKVSYLTREVLIHKFWLRDDFFLTGQTNP